jgi:hypothetical protein
MRDSHLLRALKEGGHKWNPGVKCDSRSAALEGDIFLASRAAREDQDDFAVLQHVDCGGPAPPDRNKLGRFTISGLPTRSTRTFSPGEMTARTFIQDVLTNILLLAQTSEKRLLHFDAP